MSKAYGFFHKHFGLRSNIDRAEHKVHKHTGKQQPTEGKTTVWGAIHPTSGPGSVAKGSDVETLTGCLSPRHSTLVFLNSATSTLLIPLSFYNKVSYLISTY